MKTIVKETLKCILALTTLSAATLFATTAFAQAVPTTARVGGSEGSKGGGGGDASEARVDEIRADILRWISEGGAQKLSLPPDLPLEEYVSSMKKILTPRSVIIAFTDNQDEVKVDGIPKTCRSYYSNLEVHLLCHIKRFSETPEADQYSLIHHEYAGLVRIEKNEGAASDYAISSQLTGFLKPTQILKLSLQKRAADEIVTGDTPAFASFKPLWKNAKAVDLEHERKLIGKRFACFSVEFHGIGKGETQNVAIQTFPAIGTHYSRHDVREAVPGTEVQIVKLNDRSYLVRRSKRIEEYKGAIWEINLPVSQEVRMDSQGRLLLRTRDVMAGHKGKPVTTTTHDLCIQQGVSDGISQ